MDKITGTLQGMGQLVGNITGQGGVSGAVSRPAQIPVDPYDGEYEITPTQETQTLEIAGLKATANIVINPIPSNYGKITWNGMTLSVI